MGVFKNIKDYVTGGAAEVELTILNPVVPEDESVNVTIKVTPTGETLHANRLYLMVKALERSSTSNALYSNEFVLEENIQVNAGDSREWKFAVEVPEDAPATFFGRHFSLEWGVRASLDMPGIDPSSGWQRFVVNKKMLVILK